MTRRRLGSSIQPRAGKPFFWPFVWPLDPNEPLQNTLITACSGSGKSILASSLLGSYPNDPGPERFK